MLNDNRVLEAYIDFIARGMKELLQLTLRESEIHRKTNALNRNKNRRFIQHEYQSFLSKVQNEWEKIYDNSAQFSETMEKEDMVLRGGTIYAITLNQRHAEQFFFQLCFALKVYIMGFDDKQFSRMNKSEFFSGMVFGFTRIAMEKAFPTVMMALKNHTISVDENKKKAFVEINQKLATELHIRYNAGEELTDRRIEQMLKDMEDEREKKKIEFEEGVKSGRIHVDYASYATKEELRTGLAREACGILASIIGGSSAYYNLLPLLPAIDSKDTTKLIVASNLYSRKAYNGVLEKSIDIEETNALYLGLIAGQELLNSLPLNNGKMSLNCDEITSKLFCNGVSPTDIPQLALSYMGIASGSDAVEKIKRLNSEMLSRFTPNVKFPRAKTSDELLSRIAVATSESFRMGYHAFFRINHILPGNTFEEDKLILKQLCSQDSKPKTEMLNKYTPQSIGNKSKDDTVSSQKRSMNKTKYWLADNGTIRCLGDDCPEECNLECPIYAQTLALEQLSKNSFEEAAKMLRKAVDIEPSFADAWNNLAACYGQMGEHQKAFQAYSKSYRIIQKPNPLYGMAVASKKMGDKESAMLYVNEYTEYFGVDERIKSLHAELSDAVPTIPGRKISESDQVAMSSGEEMDNSRLDNGILSSVAKRTEKMRTYGKLFLQLLDENKREFAYHMMEEIEPEYPEAGIALGQYYQGSDAKRAKRHFKIAAEAGIHEGEWGYACLIPHSHVPGKDNSNDVEYEEYCLRAAEGGCPDAANEMGNICNRRECIAEAAYWYAMAFFLEHPQGIVSVKGIIQKWVKNGKPEEYVTGTNNYTPKRHEASISFLKSMTGQNTLDDMMRLCLDGETLAGLTAAYFFEQAKKNELAFKAYNALAFEDHPHVLRCYADMLLAGKGTERDIEGAFKIYEQAANGGNATAMFAMGQKVAKTGDNYLAACWFGQAYSRGMNMAADWLKNLSELS